MTIYFSNPGTFDIRLLSIFGVSAKPNSTNPIGKFGTGLKNAVAGVLRLGGTISIHSGQDDWTIFAKEENFRGATHQMVYLLAEGQDPVPLSFSVDLGSHWQPWMIYREFFCNSKDEGGGKPSTTYPRTTGVVFCVECPAIEAILSQHSSFFIEGKPITTLGLVEIYPGQSNHAYYKGVRVHTNEKKFLYTYNFLSGLHLTEDRTVDRYDVLALLKQELMSKSTENDKRLLRSILTADLHEDPEGQIDYDWSWVTPSAAFNEEVCALARTHRQDLTPSAQKWAKKHAPEEVEVETVPFTPAQEEMVDQAKARLLSTLGLKWSYPTFMSPEVSATQRGMTVGGKVYLKQSTFSSLPELYSTMLEEHLHISTGHRDCTREFQEDLHSIIQRLAFKEEL